MNFLSVIIALLLASFSEVRAEVIDSDNNALPVFGTACEEIKAGEPNASTRLKATDKACYGAITALPEIVNIKDSFDDHDFNVIIYNIVDEYIEDLTTKTIQQDDEKICIEVSGYITPENIGKAIDEAILIPEKENTEKVSQPVIAQEPVVELEPLVAPVQPIPAPESHIIVLSTIHIRPTEFYNHTQSRSHSRLLENILSQSENIKLVEDENEANFIITPKVLKAKIEPLNKETSRMQMVVALEVFDKNKNSTTTEHQNKFVLFNNADNEQIIAKDMLQQLFEQGSISLINMTDKSSRQAYKKQPELPQIITSMPTTNPVSDAFLMAE